MLAMTIGCDSGSTNLRDLAGFAEPLLLPGYTDLRVERESPDVGISVFSYKLPPGTTRDAAVAGLHDQVKQRYPCYQVTTDSEGSLQLRCPDVPGRLHGTTEIRAIVDGNSQRAFVLMLRSIPADTAVYREFVSTLEQAVQRAQRR